MQGKESIESTTTEVSDSWIVVVTELPSYKPNFVQISVHCFLTENETDCDPNMVRVYSQPGQLVETSVDLIFKGYREVLI